MSSENELKLIPIYENYMEYMIQTLIKLPRTEKFSIGTDFKQIMYSTLEDIMYITDFDMSNLEKYITKDMIFERRKGKFNWKK